MRIDEVLRREIVTAVREAERGSALEVVVTAVPRAAPHWDVALAAALGAVLAILALAAALVHDASPLAVLLDAAFAALVGGGAVRLLPPLERALLPARVAERRVETGAESAFCRQGVFRTRGHVGVLLYVALLERRAVLLLDEAPARALPPDAQAALHAEVRGLFGGPDPRAALLAVLARLRDLGARHLPAGAGKVNELPDEPVTG